MGRTNAPAKREFKVKTMLLDDLKRRSEVFIHAEQPKIIDRDCKTFPIKQCCELGVCVCGHGHASSPDVRHFFENFKAWARSVFYRKKKIPTPARKLLEDDHRIFLSFTSAETDGSEMGPQEHFAHVGLMNFRSFHFAILKMQRHSTLDDGAIILQRNRSDAHGVEISAGEVHTDMHFVKDFLDLSRPWTVAVLIMSDQERHWHCHACIQVRELVPVIAFKGVEHFTVWRGSEIEAESRKHLEKKKRKKTAGDRPEPDGLEGAERLLRGNGRPKRARVARPPIVEDAGAAQGGAEQELDIQSGIHAGNASDSASAASVEFEEFEDMNPYAVPGGNDSEHDEDVEDAAALDDGDWDGQESMSPNECTDQSGGEDIMNVAGDTSLHTQKTAVHAHETDAVDMPPCPSEAASSARPAVAAVFDPVPEAAAPHMEVASNANPKAEGADEPEAKTDKKTREAGGRNAFATESFKVGSHGELRYHSGMQIMTAVCNEPDHDDCRRQRTVVASDAMRTAAQKGRGRPVGHLVAWLRSQGRFSSQRSHCHDFKCSLEERVAAREFLYSLPGGREFAAMSERPQREEEGEEPKGI